MLSWLVALTPLLGAVLFPIVVSITIAKVSLGAGIISALVLSSVWFLAMLSTAEMPH